LDIYIYEGCGSFCAFFFFLNLQCLRFCYNLS
jgi:hypothetical protein